MTPEDRAELVACETQVRNSWTGEVGLLQGCRFIGRALFNPGGGLWLDVEVDGERRAWNADECEVAR